LLFGFVRQRIDNVGHEKGMSDVDRAGAEVAAVEDALDFGSGATANGLFEEIEGAARTVVGGNHGY